MQALTALLTALAVVLCSAFGPMTSSGLFYVGWRGDTGAV